MGKITREYDQNVEILLQKLEKQVTNEEFHNFYKSNFRKRIIA